VTSARKTLVIVCGEPSGETYAAGVARAFRARRPQAAMEGLGGRRLAAEGVRLLADYGPISVVGFVEAAARLPRILRLLRAVRRRVREPDVGAVLLVDFPEFNFRVGHAAAAAGVPVIYFVPPQLWAWRRGRARDLARFTRGVVVPFPFEEEILRRAGVAARFAGHPLMVELGPFLAAGAPGEEGAAEGGPVVGLLPGSREGEIRRHWPLMLRAAAMIRARFPGVRFLVPVAGPGARALVEEGLKEAAVCATIVEEERYRAFGEMDTALCASGTATLELALLGVPSVIVYRTSPLTYWVGRRLASVRHIGLPNLVGGAPFLPELVQGACRPERMAEEVAGLLGDPGRRLALRAACLALRERLRGEGPYEVAAEMIDREWEGTWGC